MPDELPAGDSEDFPRELLSPDKVNDVIVFLQSISLPIQSKRRKLWNWAKDMGLQLDKSYYARLAGGVEPPRF